MISVVVTIHVVVCVALTIVILLQHGKGADVGAVFGGSSQTVFGAGGAGNALTKATWSLAAIFFATSIVLALSSARRVSGSIFDRPFSSGSSSLMHPVSKKAPGSAAPAIPAKSAPNPAGNATPASQP
jgi:preprotein translocase subunit SecG